MGQASRLLIFCPVDNSAFTLQSLSIHQIKTSCCFQQRRYCSARFNHTIKQGRMKLSILVLVTILASTACAKPVDPCLICPDGATTDYDFRPYAYGPWLNVTWADLIDEINVIEAGSGACKEGAFKISGLCAVQILCLGRITVGEYFLPCYNCTVSTDWSSSANDYIWTPLTRDSTFCETCKNLVDSAAVTYRAGSKLCTLNKDQIKPFCCPTTPKNPCITCPDYVAADDTFASKWWLRSIGSICFICK